MFVRQMVLWAVAVVLAGCALPAGLNEDGYNAKKYDLPPVLRAGATKVITVSAGAGWAFIPVTQNTYYEISVTDSSTGTLTVYHADKTTAYVTGSAGTALGFIASATENAFVKLSQPGTGSGSATLSCVTFPVLTPGVWQNGSLADDSNGGALPNWYAFPVVAGTSYDLSLNDSYSGDGTKSGYVEVEVYKADRNTELLASVTQAYLSPIPFVPATSGVVFVEVTNPYYSSSSSTYAVRVRPTAPPTALTSGSWHSDTVSGGGTLWYSFNVTAGQMYDFNTNDQYSGDGSKTGYTWSTIYHADRSTAYSSNISSAYSYPASFVATVTETIYIAVYGESGGTFAIRIQPTPITALSPGVWLNDTVASNGIRWYSFTAAGATSYKFFMNNKYQGDASKTGYTSAAIYHSDAKTAYASGLLYEYTSGTTLTPAAGTVFIAITAGSGSGGTFAIEYQ